MVAQLAERRVRRAPGSPSCPLANLSLPRVQVLCLPLGGWTFRAYSCLLWLPW